MPRKVKISTPNSGVSSNDNLLNSSMFFDFLNDLYPDKVNFSTTEVATILNVSYEFVRERILNGSIASAKFGNRPMISVFELERILTVGVK